MKTSISTLKVNQKAQKSVDVAEGSIKRFKSFLSSRTGSLPAPAQDSQISRASNFIKNFKGPEKKGGGGLLGKLAMGAGALILLPMLLSKGASATPQDVTNQQISAYGGDDKAVQKDVKKAEATKAKGKKGFDDAAETGKEISKDTIDDVKNIDKDKEAGKQPPEQQAPEAEEAQDAISQETEGKVEALSGTSDAGELDVTVKDTNKFGELVARFEKLAKAGSFMEGKPEVVGGTLGSKLKRVGAGLLDKLTFNAFDFDKKNKKRKEGKDEDVTVVPIKITKAAPQEDAMGQKKPTTKGTMDTESEDFAALTAVSALEGGDDQARADVAQSIYNRQADGTYGGTVKEVVTADGQYQPAYKDPNVSSGPGTKTSEEFKNIKDKKTAVKAMMSYYERRGQDVTEKQMQQLYDKTAAALQNPEIQESAAKHVGGRTEFLGGKVKGDDVVDRGGYEDNAFFQEYGSGDQMERGAVANPLMSDASTVQGVENPPEMVPPEQYPEYSEESGGGGQQTILAMMPKKAPPVPTDSAPTGGGGTAPPEFVFLGNTSQEVMSSMQIQGLGAS
tara:strand:- start:126 stop:1811 length:1686 start_codon:yes stop_codon:yes gene_type:complete